MDRAGTGHPLPPHDRPAPAVAAAAFVRARFPDCAAALLAGSVVRGEGRANSDLDLVVIQAGAEPGWATHHELGWPIEVFLQTPESYPAAFAHDRDRRWPLLPALCAEGVMLADREGLGRTLQAAAVRLLADGPAALSDDEVAWRRYDLTWKLEDFEDVEDRDEARLLAHDLAVAAAELHLALRRRWLGPGKWLLRSLRRSDPAAGDEFARAQTACQVAGDKEPLLRFAREVLGSVGGPRFEGRRGNWWPTA